MAYQHKILQLLLQEKTTRGMNDRLSTQLSQLEGNLRDSLSKKEEMERKLKDESQNFKIVEEGLRKKLEDLEDKSKYIFYELVKLD